MNNISITPGKNNIGAYIDNVNLNNLKDSPIKQIKETLAKYGVIFIKKQNRKLSFYRQAFL